MLVRPLSLIYKQCLIWYGKSFFNNNIIVTIIYNVILLPKSDGICHVYVDKSANLEMAKQIVLDAKTDYPSGCNAMVINVLDDTANSVTFHHHALIYVI